MPLPTNTTKEDVDAIVAFLRNKPVGIPVGSAKATIDARLVDSRKLNAYRAWGFVTEDSGKLMLTKTGREYSQATEDEKKDFYGNVVRNERIYFLTTEWLFNRGFDQIAATDVASHWFTHFRQDMGSESE